MTKRLVFAAVIVCGLILLAPAPAHAKLYGGLGIGQSSTSDFHEDDIDDGSFISGSVDDSDTSWKGFIGFRFLKFLGVELAYVDFGKYTINAESGGGILYAPGSVVGTADADTVALHAMGILPLGNFSIYAKAGYHSWSAKQSISDSLGPIESSSESGEDLTYGLGVAYSFKSSGGLRLEYELYELDDVDVDVITIGYAYNF